MPVAWKSSANCLTDFRDAKSSCKIGQTKHKVNNKQLNKRILCAGTERANENDGFKMTALELELCNAVQLQFYVMQCSEFHESVIQWNAIWFKVGLIRLAMPCNATRCKTRSYNAAKQCDTIQCNVKQWSMQCKTMINAMQCKTIIWCKCNPMQPHYNNAK